MADLGWSTAQVAEITGGRLVGPADRGIERVVIDSRQDTDRALFVALVGERFDGHDFLEAAIAGGAAAVLIAGRERAVDAPQIVVDDTLAALQTLGLARRRRFSGPLIAITGSSGKTTTRRLLASIVSQRHSTHQPLKNFNNHVGVPLTLLDLEQSHGAAVLELGCSGFGEIAALTRLSEPDVGLVTNVGPAHLEQLGDLDGVARAKGELFAELAPDALAVVNLDDPRVAAMPVPTRESIKFGTAGNADVRLLGRRSAGLDGQVVELELRGERIEARIALHGAHNASNALAAAAAALALELSPAEIVTGLGGAEPSPGRLVPGRGPAGSLLIDDTYNANPASTRAALEVLEELAGPGERIAVLGDMLELGRAGPGAHREIGARAGRAGLALLVTIGEGGALIDEGAAGAGLSAALRLHAPDHARAAAAVRERVERGYAVLVKGSRGMRMERVVHELLEGED